MAKKKPTPKKRSAKSYKLGAQKASATRAKNKLKKELQKVNLFDGRKKYVYEGKLLTKKRIQNSLIDKIIRINTDFLEPINKKLSKLSKGKKRNSKNAISKFRDKEGVVTFASAKVWQKSKFEKEVLQSPEITKINGKSVKKDLDEIQEAIDEIFTDMTSESVACYAIDKNGNARIFKLTGDELESEESDIVDI